MSFRLKTENEMQPENDWETLRAPRARRVGAISPLRVALLFGMGALALTAVAMSYLGDERNGFVAQNGSDVDMMATGSIGRGAGYGGAVNSSKTYTVRRSILQNSPDAVCIIRPNGTSIGQC
jgi:hypothetical protein